MEKKEKFEIALGIISFIGLVIIAIINKSYKGLIAIGIMILLTAILFLIIFLLDLSIERKIKKIIKHYGYLKSKSSINIYEELYILTFQNKIEELLKDEFKKNKLKDIHSLDVYIENINEVDIIYKYSSCEVLIEISNNNIKYSIDTPSKYDGIDANKEFEKKKDTNININSFNDFDLFIDSLVLLIEQTLNEINNFKNNNIVDEVFNGRLINKLRNSSSYLKQEGYVCAILGPILLIIFTIITVFIIKDTDYIKENPLGYYMGILFSILFVAFSGFCTIYGLNYIFKYRNMLDDIKNKRTTVITEQPVRIRIIKDQLNKYNSRRTLRYIKLYFKHTSILIPYINNEYVRKPKNIKLTIDKLLDLECNITYLSKSRIAIKGGEKYISLSKKYLM